MTMRIPLPAILMLAAVGLAGCGTLDQGSMVPEVQHIAAVPTPATETASAIAAARAAPGPTRGSIYDERTWRPYFENPRASHVGDSITIAITEKVSATQKSTSSVDKSGSLETSVDALAGLSAGKLGRLGATAKNANSFSGKGTTENSNDFSGTITATVVNVLPNGHLIVAGEKQIGVNANVDMLRFSGEVDPATIGPGNIVSSMAVANVRIEQRGRGQEAQAQSMGWLGRFFLSWWPL